jgi:hypothetical protein
VYLDTAQHKNFVNQACLRFGKETGARASFLTAFIQTAMAANAAHDLDFA